MNIFYHDAEKKLAEIWHQLLSVEPNENSNFFAIGGNSLLLIRLSIFIGEQMGIEADVSGLLKNPTFSDMIAYLNGKKQNIEKEISIPKYTKQYYNHEHILLSSSQKDIWSQVKLNNFSYSNYNMPFCFHLLGELNVAQFEKAFSKLIKRHRIFSTNISTDNHGEPYISSDVHHIPFHFLDFSSLAEQDKKDRVIEIEQKEFNRKIELENSPLVYVQLIKLSDDEYYFYFTTHHIIFDGVSCDIFLQELMSLYKGEKLPEIQADYLDYSNWENSQAYQEDLKPGLDYWENRLQNFTPLNLPFITPNSIDHITDLQFRQLSIEKLEALQKMAQNHDTTLFTIFSLALQIILNRFKNDGDISFGAYTSRRVYSDFTHTIGNFINPVILRFDFNINQSIAESLSNTHQQITQDFTWQHIPLKSIIEKITPIQNKIQTLFNISLVFNENVLKNQYEQGNLRIKLESKKDHHIVFAFDTDIEFIVHSNSNGLFVGAAYLKNKVGDEFVSILLDELLRVLLTLPNMDDSLSLSSISL